MAICIGRLARGYIYWYFTKAIKLNGSIFIKRDIPSLSDPLKFAIALDFIKKSDHRKCMKKLCQARNKPAIYECFRYLFYGRKVILKNLAFYEANLVFYTLTI